MGRAVTSFSARKLDAILDEIHRDAEVIAKLVPIVQEQNLLSREARAEKERQFAATSRDEISKFMKEERLLRIQLEKERERVY